MIIITHHLNYIYIYIDCGSSGKFVVQSYSIIIKIYYDDTRLLKKTKKIWQYISYHHERPIRTPKKQNMLKWCTAALP